MTDLRGRVVLVTGASSGLGRAVAAGVAARGATVLAVSRAGGDGERGVDELRRSTGNERHDFLPADLSAQTEVRALAARVRARHERLDGLVNNAGGFFPRRRESVDGFEMTFALDHLAGMLLTLLLLEPLAAAGGRVVTTASLSARWGRLHRDVDLHRGYNGFFAYAQAKLANLLFTVELGRRLPRSTVAVHAFDPGVVRTAIGSGHSFLELCIRVAQAGFGVEPEVGARTALVLLGEALPAGANGGLWRDGARMPLPRVARDPRLAARLWDVSVERLALTDEELAPLRRLSAAAAGAGS